MLKALEIEIETDLAQWAFLAGLDDKPFAERVFSSNKNSRYITFIEGFEANPVDLS